MIADNPEALTVAKSILYNKIAEMAHSSWGWTNIHDVISKIRNEEPPNVGMMFTRDDLVFVYWILLAEGKVFGTSPIVKVDDEIRVVWFGDTTSL